MRTTAIKMALSKAKDENKKLLIKYLYKYSDFKNSRAIEELLKVDYIRNNFKKTTLNFYLTGVRKYLNTGVKDANIPLPSYLFETVDELKSSSYAKLRPSDLDKYSERPTERGVKEVQEGNSTQTTKRISTELNKIKKALLKEDATYTTAIQELKSRIIKMEEKQSSISQKVNAINIVLGL